MLSEVLLVRRNPVYRVLQVASQMHSGFRQSTWLEVLDERSRCGTSNWYLS